MVLLHTKDAAEGQISISLALRRWGLRGQAIETGLFNDAVIAEL